MNIQTEWTSSILEIFSKKEELRRQALDWPPQDQSLSVLEELARRGYSEVRWSAPNAMCFTCRDLHEQVWPLDEFIWFTKHSAPIFSKSHVGCRCFLVVSGIDVLTKEELPMQTVEAY